MIDLIDIRTLQDPLVDLPNLSMYKSKIYTQRSSNRAQSGKIEPPKFDDGFDDDLDLDSLPIPTAAKKRNVQNAPHTYAAPLDDFHRPSTSTDVFKAPAPPAGNRTRVIKSDARPTAKPPVLPMIDVVDITDDEETTEESFNFGGDSVDCNMTQDTNVVISSSAAFGSNCTPHHASRPVRTPLSSMVKQTDRLTLNAQRNPSVRGGQTTLDAYAAPMSAIKAQQQEQQQRQPVKQERQQPQPLPTQRQPMPNESLIRNRPRSAGPADFSRVAAPPTRPPSKSPFKTAGQSTSAAYSNRDNGDFEEYAYDDDVELMDFEVENQETMTENRGEKKVEARYGVLID